MGQPKGIKRGREYLYGKTIARAVNCATVARGLKHFWSHQAAVHSLKVSDRHRSEYFSFSISPRRSFHVIIHIDHSRFAAWYAIGWARFIARAPAWTVAVHFKAPLHL